MILSLDWLDVAGTLKLAGDVKVQVIQASLDYQLHNGWGMEHQALPALNLRLACGPDVAMHAIADALGVGAGEMPGDLPIKPALNAPDAEVELDIMTQAGALGEGLEGVCASFVCLPLGWAGEAWHFRHPLDFEGSDRLRTEGWEVVRGPQITLGVPLRLTEEQRQALLSDVAIIVVSSRSGLSDADLDASPRPRALVLPAIGVGAGDLGGLCRARSDRDEWCNAQELFGDARSDRDADAGAAVPAA